MPRKKLGRARNGEGQYKTLPSGLIRMVKRHGGQRLSGPAMPTRDAAKSAWEEQHLSPEKPKATPTLGSWSFSLLNDQTGLLNDQRAPSTLDFERNVYETNIKPHAIAEKRIEDLTVDDVDKWRRSLKTKAKKKRVGGTRRNPVFEVTAPKPMAPTTQARYLSVMRLILGEAVRRNMIPVNVALSVRPPAQNEEIVKIVLTPEQQAEFLKHFEGRLRRAVILGLHGLRRGEIGGLRYEDFERRDGVPGFWVKRQVQELAGGVIVRPFAKGKKRRWVALDDDGAALFKEKATGYVIGGPNGKPIWPHNLNRDIVNKLKGTEWEGVHPHDLRSSTAMSLLRATDIRTAADLLGHSPAVLAKTYARSNPELMQEAMRRRKGPQNEGKGGTDGATKAA
jgi:integrase